MCLQLASVVQSTEPVPLDYSELSGRFGMLLAEAGESRRVLLILDGLDQLVRIQQDEQCRWQCRLDVTLQPCSFRDGVL